MNPRVTAPRKPKKPVADTRTYFTDPLNKSLLYRDSEGWLPFSSQEKLKDMIDRDEKAVA
jgi:hypothetical protein